MFPAEKEQSTDVGNMTPAEWLEHLRITYGYDDDPAVSFEISGATKDETEWLQQERRGLERQLKRETEQQVISARVECIRSVMHASEISRMGDVFFGIFPTYSFDAFAGFSPRGDRVVTLHSAMAATLDAWAKFFVAKMDGRIKSNELFWLCYSIGSAWIPEFQPLIPSSGHFTPKTVAPLSEDSCDLARVLSESAIFFVIAHEIGHILEGHTEYHPSDANFNHDMEFAADAWGLRLCLRHALRAGESSDDTFITKFAMLGPHLALSAIATISDIQTSDHPSVERRFARIQDGIEAELEAYVGKKRLRKVLRDLDEDWPSRLRGIGQKLYQQHLDLRDLISEMRARVPSTTGSRNRGKWGEIRRLLPVAPPT